MPIYHYKARDEEGRIISGTVDVSGEEEFQKRLESSGFFLVKFTREKRSLLTEDLVNKFQRITLRDVYTFTLQLGNTVGTGVPLLASLRSIIEGSRNRKFTAILNEVIEDLKAGISLSKALGKHAAVFPPSYTGMVELGESSGQLAKIMASLAEYIKKEMEMKQRIIFALTYPAILAVIGMGLVSYILIHIMPQFIEIFAQEKIGLPLPTLILLTLSKIFSGYWYLLLLLIAFLVIGFRLFVKGDEGKLIIDRLKLSLPVIGKLEKKVCAKRFIDGLHVLYGSGFPLLGALNIVRSMLNNKHIEKIIDALWVHMATGKDFASYLSLVDLYPPDIVAMIRSGEESGALDKMLEKISSIYQDEVNYSIERLISTFEIMVIVGIGVCVGFVALAVLLPIFNLSKTISGR